MDKGTITRTVVLIVALINQLLAAFGYSPLPFEGAEVEQAVSSVITVAAALWAWFKNNYVTEKGKKQKEVLRRAGAE